MLVNLQRNKTALEIIEKLPFEFHLTGSRLFCPSFTTYETDWDFYVANSEEVVEALMKEGFHAPYLPHYGDSLCVRVMEMENVDIQLRNDIPAHKEKEKKLLALGEKAYHKIATNFAQINAKEMRRLWDCL